MRNENMSRNYLKMLGMCGSFILTPVSLFFTGT